MLTLLRSHVTVLALACLALALPTGAAAAPAYEPNDGIDQAFGPLAAGANYDATVSAQDDTDWYVLYVSGGGVLDVELSNTDDDFNCCSSVPFALLDADGKELNSGSPYENEVEHIVYTTPGPGRYYVRVDGGAGDRYRLRLTGPLTGGPRPGQPQLTPNSNKSLQTAFGPLLGGKLYGGSVDATDEEDWFYFYGRRGAIDIALTNRYDSLHCCSSVTLALLDASGQEINSTSAYEDTVGHVRYTVPKAGKFMLRATGGTAADRYQFEIAPASLLTTKRPVTTSKACSTARKARKRAQKRVRAARGKVRAANGRKARRKARKVLKKRQASLRKAKRQVKRRC